MLTQILICENERDILNLYSKSLERSYDVIKTTTMEECVSAFNDARPALVLMDYRLDDGTGIEALRTINEIEMTKGIMVTALDLPARVLSMMYDHDLIQEAVVKPISANSLHYLVARVMDHCMVCGKRAKRGGLYKTAREWPCTWCEGTGVFTEQAYLQYARHRCDCLSNPNCMMCHKQCHCNRCLGFV